MLINEYELIYLYQENNCSKILLMLLNHFQHKLTKLQKWVYNKYFFLPLENYEFISFQFLAIKSCVNSYNMKSHCSFQTYLFQYFRWIINKYMHQFISNKHLVLNLANYNYQNFSLVFNENNYFLENSELKKICLDLLKIFSSLEQKVFYLWYKNYSILEISKILHLNYRQVDNTKQRIIKKIKDYQIKNKNF